MVFDPNSSILVIFFRRPALGVGKQRIAAELGTEAALEAANLLLECALEDAQTWPGPVILSPASAADTDWATSLLPGSTIIPQCEGNFGDRIAHVQKATAALGASGTVFIGSDAPSLNPGSLAEAAAKLSQHDTVVIPARDGGVTLLGSRVTWPDLSNLSWETPQLCDDLLKVCQQNNLSSATLPAGDDIDTLSDLVAATTYLAEDLRPSRQKLLRWIHAQQIAPIQRTSISIIIPVFNDHEALLEQLQRITALKPSAQEVIVIDASSDAGEPQSACLRFGARHITSAPSRGKQLRTGAQASSGEILWFLHVDSVPTDDALQRISLHISSGQTAGYFLFRFTGPATWYKTALETLINFRAALGIPYGDQGIFVTREAYFAAGQHATSPLFEEVPLIKNLRASGNCKPVKVPIGVSPRRWERDGWLKRSLHNRWLALRYMLGVAPERLARQYDARSETKK